MSQDSAQLFGGVHDTPVHTDFPVPQAPAVVGGRAGAALGLTPDLHPDHQDAGPGHAAQCCSPALVTGLLAGHRGDSAHGPPRTAFRAAVVARPCVP